MALRLNSQPFWGSMIAAAGAGPEPIPQKSLNSQNLMEAIQFCLSPDASTAAQKIANKMRRESGVAQAVRSFHANLPLEKIRCDMLPYRPAVWSYKRDGFRLKLSKLAAEVLANHLRVEFKSLKL
jgi:hypothetical protein